MGQLSIKSFTIKDVAENPGIFSTYKDPHGYLKYHGRTWVKLLQDNPYGKETDLSLILTLDDDVIVGELGLFAGGVVYNNREERTFWLARFFLEGNYKNSGAGGLMLLRAIQFSKCLLACGAPREDTEKLYDRTGFSRLGPLKRFVFFYRAGLIMKKYIKNRFLASFGAAILSPLLKGYYRMKIGKININLSYQQVKKFERNFDELIAMQTKAYFPKYTNTLNWILKHKKNLFPFKILQNDKLVGYCILRRSLRKEEEKASHNLPEMTVGSLLDYFLIDFSEKMKRDLVLFCIDFFKKKKVDIFECQVCDPDIDRICSNYGMIHLGGNRIFFRPSIHKTFFDHKRSWFITHGTGDVILGAS